jgi:hypothetical protein
VWPAVWRCTHPVFGWLYTIHEHQQGLGLRIHWNVSQEQIVKAMEEFATFKSNDYVQLGRSGWRRRRMRRQEGIMFSQRSGILLSISALYQNSWTE